MNHDELDAFAMLTNKVDDLAGEVRELSVGLAKLNGRFEGGWWVLAALGAAFTALLGWVGLTHAHVRVD